MLKDLGKAAKKPKKITKTKSSKIILTSAILSPELKENTLHKIKDTSSQDFFKIRRSTSPNLRFKDVSMFGTRQICLKPQNSRNKTTPHNYSDNNLESKDP